MTVNEYDEERATSPMDWEEEEEVLRQQFDSIDDDDDDDSDWRPIGKEPRPTTSDRELRSTKDCWTGCPRAIGGLHSWSQSFSLVPNTSSSQSAEGKEDGSLRIDIRGGNIEQFTNSDGNPSVEVQLSHATVKGSSSPPVSFHSEDSADEAKRQSYSSGAGLKDVITRNGSTAKNNRNNEIKAKTNNGAGKNKLEKAQGRAGDFSRSQTSSYSRVAREACQEPAPFLLSRPAPAPSPFPISGPAPPGFAPCRPKDSVPTLSEVASAPPSFPFPPTRGILAGDKPDYSKGGDELGSEELQKSNCNKPSQTRSVKARASSEGMGLHDLGVVVKQEMDRELRRPVVVKEVLMPSSSSNEAKKADVKSVKSKAEPFHGGKAKKEKSSAQAFQPVKQKGKPSASPRLDGFKQNSDGSAKQRKSSQFNNSKQSADRPAPSEAKIHTVENKSAPKQWYAVPPPSRHAKKPSLNEVCILLDNSNASMEKLLPPLRGTLGRFLDLVSSTSEEKVGISMLTPSRKLDFAASKEELISYCNQVRREELDCNDDDLSIIEGLARTLRRLDTLSWTPGSTRYIYIFTNLSDWDSEDDALRWKLRGRLCGVAHHIPRGAKTVVGCWMNDNALLEEALNRANRNFKTFPLLDAKYMATFVIHDNDLLQGLLASLASITLKQKRIRFGNNNQRGPSTGFLGGPAQYITSEATMFQMKPLDTIQDVLSTGRPTFLSRGCWMKRTKVPHHVNYDEVFSLGKLGLEKGAWKEQVMLKSFKLDEINGKKGKLSEECFKNRAYVAAVAKFFASQYNKEHRPENCAKIKFLNGYVIERTCEKGHLHVAYAEQLLTNGEEEIPILTEFCDSSGQWDESLLDESLLRFALTCFKLSGGDLMLSGLKGIRRDNGFVLRVPSLLSKKNGDAHASDCTKEYMKLFRKRTKTLLDEKDWMHSKKPAAEVPAKGDNMVKNSPVAEDSGYLPRFPPRFW